MRFRAILLLKCIFRVCIDLAESCHSDTVFWNRVKCWEISKESGRDT